MTAWNPELYLRFADERMQPSLDLIARIGLEAPSRIMDLGCGPGNSTQVLRRRWPYSLVCGMDNSPEMIAAAQAQFPTEKWLCKDVASWQADNPFDLVFSNAALHWLSDHAILFPRLLAQVAAGGALAVQIPARSDSPLQHITLETAQLEKWRERLQPATRALTKESLAFYHEVLRPLATRLDLWETDYIHILDGAQSVVTWFRGTGLRPYLAALSENEQADFLQAILQGCEKAYPQQRDGRVLFTFRRLFIIAYK